MNIDAIKGRVRKLLNLANDDSAVGGEIDNAIRFAKKLMDEHHLTEADVAKVDEKIIDLEKAEMCRQFVTFGANIHSWEGVLACTVTEIIGGVRVYRNDSTPKVVRDARGFPQFDAKGEPMYGPSFVFYGIAEDVKMAKDLFYELRTTIIAMSRLRYGTVYRKEGKSYCDGFVLGIRLANQNEQAEQLRIAEGQKQAFGESTALVLVQSRGQLVKAKSHHADKWLKQTEGITLGKAKHVAGFGGNHHEAFAQGKTDGRATKAKPARQLKIKG